MEFGYAGLAVDKWYQRSPERPYLQNLITGGKSTQWRDTHHAAVGLAGSKGSDDERNVQVGVDPPALVAALQTADVILQLSLVQLVDQVSLRRRGTRVRPPRLLFTANSKCLRNSLSFHCVRKKLTPTETNIVGQHC